MELEIVDDTVDRPLSRMNAGKSAAATRVRLPLKTLDQCAVEAAKVYRLARTGQMAMADATRFVFMLTSISRMLIESDVESRFQLLEDEVKRLRRQR